MRMKVAKEEYKIVISYLKSDILDYNIVSHSKKRSTLHSVCMVIPFNQSFAHSISLNNDIRLIIWNRQFLPINNKTHKTSTKKFILTQN